MNIATRDYSLTANEGLVLKKRLYCVSRRAIYKDLIASIALVRWIVHRRRIKGAVLINRSDESSLRRRQSTPPNDTNGLDDAQASCNAGNDG